MIGISIKVVVYGVPALLIILGWVSLVMSSDAIFSGINVYGGWLLGFGIFFYTIEGIAFRFGFHA